MKIDQNMPPSKWLFTGLLIRNLCFLSFLLFSTNNFALGYSSNFTYTEEHFRGSAIPISFTVSDPPASDGLLSLSARGDLWDSNEFVEVKHNGTSLGRIFTSTNLGCVDWGDYCHDNLVIPKDILESAVNVGSVVFELYISLSNGAGSVFYQDINLCKDQMFKFLISRVGKLIGHQKFFMIEINILILNMQRLWKVIIILQLTL